MRRQNEEQLKVGLALPETFEKIIEKKLESEDPTGAATVAKGMVKQIPDQIEAGMLTQKYTQTIFPGIRHN